jgi:hypothetical protein
MGRFEPEYPVERLRGADYNPRAIDDDAIATLAESITEIGFAKNIIVTESLTVAGHQRSKAAVKLGRRTVPAYVLEDISKTDEISFNQLHNGTDVDLVDKPVRVPPSEIVREFVDVPARDIDGDLPPARALDRHGRGPSDDR